MELKRNCKRPLVKIFIAGLCSVLFWTCQGDDYRKAKAVCDSESAYTRGILFVFPGLPRDGLPKSAVVKLSDTISGTALSTRQLAIDTSNSKIAVKWEGVLRQGQVLELSVAKNTLVVDSFRVRPRAVTAGIGNRAYDGCVLSDLRINNKWVHTKNEVVDIY